VPDVFFTEKDKFNNEIKQVARLLPVEYLLIDVPVSTPVEQRFDFNKDRTKKAFPIEHRMLDGHLQDFNALIAHLDQFSKDEFLSAVNDFHFLIYIATMDMLPMISVMDPLLKAIRDDDKKAALEWCKSDKWATVETLIAAQKPGKNFVFNFHQSQCLFRVDSRGDSKRKKERALIKTYSFDCRRKFESLTTESVAHSNGS
jgi:nuclear protein localization family protein 4